MTVDLTAPEFHDTDRAREWLEQSRWPEGAFCPHCGSTRVARMGGKGHRPGLFHCPDCRGQFTVLTGSVMESSHIPLPKWVLAIRLLTASKKGMSAHQLHRMLNITYKSAWFMAHRIREAMADPKPSPLGGEGKVVEADETYQGKTKKRATSAQRGDRPFTKGGTHGPGGKRPVVALVERGGKARAVHMPQVTARNVHEFVLNNAGPRSRLHTDESRLYPVLGEKFSAHETVNHSAKEYARGDVNTNSVEGFFGIFKRGLNGVYQHCGEQHLQRYLDEFAFRYSNRSKLGIEDQERARRAAKGGEGKRLTYRRLGRGEEAATGASAG